MSLHIPSQASEPLSHGGVSQETPGDQARQGGLLEIEHLDKAFYATHAVRDVSFSVGKGEIVALLGQNGAGKSTIIKMLAGVYKPDSGVIRLAGNPLQAGDSREGKIAFVHQTLALVDWMTAAENMAQVAGYRRRLGLISRRRTRAYCAAVLSELEADIDPDRRVFDLTRTQRNVLAIARALSLDPAILVLDEPTASLPAKDVARFFETLERLKTHDVGIVFVSHRLDEVYEIADRAVVLRNGAVVADRPITDFPRAEMVQLIAGKDTSREEAQPPQSATRLSVEDVVVDRVGPVTFSLRHGEILGLCGLRGAGQEDIGRALAGVTRADSGRFVLDGVGMVFTSVKDAISKGVGFTTSNRETEAIFPLLSALENLLVNPPLWGFRRWAPLKAAGQAAAIDPIFTQFNVQPARPELPLDTFSGGNQQKVILARWLGIDRELLVLEEPTMGVDVGAKTEIYDLLHRAAARGLSVVVVSTDMEEVVNLCHRALVFSRGRVTTELSLGKLSVQRLIAAASELTETESR